MTKSKIILVDDDEFIRSVIEKKLRQENYDVIGCPDGKALLEKLKTNIPDAILLDLVLPDQDGLNLISDIQKQTAAPIIVVSQKDDVIDKVIGLEMGADDYITKPFEIRELTARIKANIRRYKNDQSLSRNLHDKKQQIKFDKFTLDQSKYQVTDKNGKVVDLTTREFKLLELLVTHPSRVMTREELFDILKDDDYNSYDRAIDIQVARIRKKIGDSAKSPKIIKTVREVGYILICDTEIVKS